jgi:hypothetical protein
MNLAALLWGVLFSAIGLGYFMYGKSQTRLVLLICGLALMIYPYFVSGGWATFLLGVVLTALPWLARRFF